MDFHLAFHWMCRRVGILPGSESTGQMEFTGEWGHKHKRQECQPESSSLLRVGRHDRRTAVVGQRWDKIILQLEYGMNISNYTDTKTHPCRVIHTQTLGTRFPKNCCPFSELKDTVISLSDAPWGWDRKPCWISTKYASWLPTCVGKCVTTMKHACGFPSVPQTNTSSPRRTACILVDNSWITIWGKTRPSHLESGQGWVAAPGGGFPPVTQNPCLSVFSAPKYLCFVTILTVSLH